MVNIIGQNIKYKNGEIFSVLNQTDEQHVTLNNGKTYSYCKMFSSGTFVLLDAAIQSEVMKDIVNVQKVTELLKKQDEYEQKRQKTLRLLDDLKDGYYSGRNISDSHKDLQDIGKNGFEYYKIYGRVALDIYESGCKYLGFDKSKSNSFNILQPLYDTDCSPEGYSVLMFAHSDVNGETNETWINIIDKDKYYIYTEIRETPPENEKRITFVKQKDGYYVFIGVYKLAECNENYPRKGMFQYVYILESENYRQNFNTIANKTKESNTKTNIIPKANKAQSVKICKANRPLTIEERIKISEHNLAILHAKLAKLTAKQNKK